MDVRVRNKHIAASTYREKFRKQILRHFALVNAFSYVLRGGNVRALLEIQVDDETAENLAFLVWAGFVYFSAPCAQLIAAAGRSPRLMATLKNRAHELLAAARFSPLVSQRLVPAAAG